MATRYATNHYHKKLEEHTLHTKSTMVWAPRQSGKTFALVNALCANPDGVLMVPSGVHRRPVDALLNQFGERRLMRRVYTMHSDPLLGHEVSTIYLDDVDAYGGDLDRFFQSALSVTQHMRTPSNIIAFSTPRSVRQEGLYERYFHRVIHVDDIIIPENHFEEDLFNI